MLRGCYNISFRKITVGKVWTKYSYALPLKEVDTSCRSYDIVSINPLHYITPPASESCDPPPPVVPFLHATHVLVTMEDFFRLTSEVE